MGKALALFRATLTEGMSFFRISGRNRSKLFKYGAPILFGVVFMAAMGAYGYGMIEMLAETGAEYVVLTLFALVATVIVLTEGVYKASGLLFNCRDDDTVLALPIRKSTVLLIRVMKFYLFEVMVNTLMLAPVMVVYGVYTGASVSFYLVSVVALLMLPILPIVVACIIGGLIAYFSTKFRVKSLVQILLTTLVLVIVLIASFSFQDIMQVIAQNAGSVNEAISRVCYPIGQYIDLVLNFEIWKLVVFVVTNVGLLVLMVLVLGRVYYKINSRVKVVKSGTRSGGEYKIATHRPMLALMRKEIGKFASSPVFAVNAGFGLVMYLLACVVMCINADGLVGQIDSVGLEWLTVERVTSFMPAVLFALVFMMSMMTSITSSMISLEGKSFNILKSLPMSAMSIILGKVLSAMVIMVPVFLIGDLMMFVGFGFDFWQMLMIVVASVMMPMIAELVGIIVNLKFPKMDAKNDVEVVKQSLSSLVAVFIGLGSCAVMAGLTGGAFVVGLGASEVMMVGLSIGALILAGLLLFLKKRGAREFREIEV